VYLTPTGLPHRFPADRQVLLLVLALLLLFVCLFVAAAAVAVAVAGVLMSRNSPPQLHLLHLSSFGL